jgi:sugar phosphate permease
MPILPLWFKLSYGVGPLYIGAAFAATYAFTALGSYISSMKSGVLSPLNIAMYTRILSGILLILMALSPIFLFASFFFVIRALLAGFGSPSRTAINVRGINAEDYGTATSIEGISSRIAQLSSGASGYLADIYLPLPLEIGALFQIASGISYKFIIKEKREN